MMRKSKILAKIRAGQPAKLAMMGHYLPAYIAYAAEAGYDGIWLDLEHRSMNAREWQALLAYFHLYDIDCLLRAATREKAPLYRYLEDGVAGLMIPHVSDAETARDLVNKVRFPPLGDRGLEGYGLETNFGLDLGASTDAFVDHANHETFLAVQIETPQGLANAEAIAAVPGIDCLYIGPADMGLRMAHVAEYERLSMDEVMAGVAAACKRHAKAWGLFPLTTGDLHGQRALGANLLLWGVDMGFMRDGLKASARDLETVLSG